MPEKDPLNGVFYETSIATVNQGAAGATSVIAAVTGKKIYVTGIFLTLDAAGTIKFTETAGDLTGTLNAGGVAAPPLQFSAGRPILWTSIANEALSIVTATGKAQGWITYYVA